MGIENGTETEALLDATQDEMVRIDRLGETETCLRTEGEAEDDAGVEATVMDSVEDLIEETGKRAQALLQRRRNPHQT